MAKKRKKELSMEKVREIFRLAMQCKRSSRDIGKVCRISHSTVLDYLKRSKQADLDYDKIKMMDDQALRRILKRSSIEESTARPVYPMPDWQYIHHELKKKGVTLQLLWEEYKENHPDGYQSSQFTEHYRRWKKTLRISMRQTHKAGEKMFVDYAGQTIAIRNSSTGKTHAVQIFVAVLGASNYTYAEATLTQGSEDWINSHIHAYEYFDGVTKVTVPDNLKSGVSKACRYEPDINRSYQDMAVHYGTVIIPARVRKPKDKAKAEVGVQIVERWILAKLRNRIFFSLHELNKVIKELLEILNKKPFQKLDGCRQSVFKSLDHPALLPLPKEGYELAFWKKVTVNVDYHIEVNGHYYSVPNELRNGPMLDVRCTQKIIEVFHNNKRIASHLRDDSKGRHSTIKEHMPKSHQKCLDWTPSRIIKWANTIGKHVAELVQLIMESRCYPEQGYRSCLGIIRLAKRYNDHRLEDACRRALVIGGHSYKSVRSILEKGLDQQPIPTPSESKDIVHDNIRGESYF